MRNATASICHTGNLAVDFPREGHGTGRKTSIVNFDDCAAAARCQQEQLDNASFSARVIAVGKAAMPSEEPSFLDSERDSLGLLTTRQSVAALTLFAFLSSSILLFF